MSQIKKQGFLDRSVGLIAAIEEVLTRGFFIHFSVEFSKDAEANHLMLIIRADGYIPDNSADMQSGIKPYIDVIDLLAQLRTQVQEDSVALTNHVTEVKTDGWNEYDDDGDKVVGRRGSHVTIQCSLFGNMQPTEA